MIELSNLRTVKSDGWTRLTIDISVDGGGGGQNFEPVMWIGVRDKDSHMLASDVYNAFLLIPLYMAMYYKQDLRIHGFVSKRLYRNVMNYFQAILCDFCDDLSPVNVIVDGFKEADPEPDAYVVGTGISCGVDSLTTIYDRYIHETDPEYRINTLCFFSSGQHGAYGDEKAVKLYYDRFNANSVAAEKLGLPVVLIDTNLHAFFRDRFGPFCRTAYLAFYSCIMSLERAVRKYYFSSTYSYGQMMKFGFQSRENDFSEYADPYALPLVRTENIEFIPDGSQYTREQKLERISDWKIAQEHLDVCFDYHPNCSVCGKCVRTLLPLEALGKLKAFSGVFDLDAYRKVSFREKCAAVLWHDNNGFVDGYYNFCKSHGMELPSIPRALWTLRIFSPKALVKYMLRWMMGPERFLRLKRFLKRP